MTISIITINYNGSESTIKLLKSLISQSDKNFQTIVIDNASEEEDFSNLKSFINGLETSSFPGLTLIRNENNLGFSGGNNVAIKKALENASNWVVLLNNDTWVETSFIAVLRAKLQGLEGIVGIPLIEADHTAYYGRVEWLKPTLRHGYNPPYSEYLRRNRNYYAIGGGMAIRSDVFEKIGLLDDKYFLYFEDADFNVRARKEGISIDFIDDPKIRHQEVSKTTKKLGSPTLLRYHYRNALYFNWKNGSGYIKFLVWPWSFWILKKQIWKIIFFYKQKKSMAILSGVLDFYKDKMGKI